MKQMIHKARYSVPAFFLALGAHTAMADMVVSGLPGVSSSGAASAATFGFTVDSALGASGPFATGDRLDIIGSINAAAAHVDSDAAVYMVAFKNGVAFNRDDAGVWHPWDHDMASLVSAGDVAALAAQEAFDIIGDLQEPGRYLGFIGYKPAGGDDIVYNAVPLSFTVSDMVFDTLSVPMTLGEKRQVRASSGVYVDGVHHDIGFHTLVRTNETLPRLGGAPGEEQVFGQLYDKDGAPLLAADASPWVCTNGSGPDHTSLLTYGGELFAVTQLECSLGGAYVTKLSQDAGGNLTAVSTRPVDFSTVNGTYVNCAGMTTPWNTHLGSEEYEPPMGTFSSDVESGEWYDGPQYWEGEGDWHNEHMYAIATYNKIENTAANAAAFGYHYGWIPEVRITSADGDTTVAKHYAMGRFAHELAYVMPDNRTVYLSDDGTNVGLFMFIADTPMDLSAGTLYAAKWNQTSGAGAGTADLTWINLGHATDAGIRAALDAKTTFADMFDKAEPADADAGTCPAGYTATNTYDEGFMCTRLKAGMEQVASRLETRLYAAHLGATTEFRKEEGITYNAEKKVLYVAMSELRKGMEDGASQDTGGPNHIRLAQANKCGAVYALDVTGGVSDTGGSPIDSALVAVDMYGVVAGTEKDYEGTDLAENSCDVDGIASPDNVSYLERYGALVIGEDTSGHQNDYVWNYDVNTGQLTRIATTPFGSETTSPFWHADVNGFGYLTLVVQHPYGESDEDQAEGAADKESYVGYIGPFPALD